MTQTEEFSDQILLVSHFINHHIPHSKGEIFINKILAFFKNLSTFDRETIKSCWIVDEASVMKNLFRKVQIFNESELSHKLSLNIVEIIDCMDYKGFDEYLKQRNVNNLGSNR